MLSQPTPPGKPPRRPHRGRRQSWARATDGDEATGKTSAAPTGHINERAGVEPGPSLTAALALAGGDAEKSPKGPILVNATSLGGTNFSVVLAPVD
jgi:hypothetical protein